jgi:hypothetical protein
MQTVAAAAPASESNGRSRARAQRPLPPLTLPRQLARDELLTRVADLPSRKGKRKPRRDLADNLGRFYDALWRHAHARHTARYRLTHHQLARACGYKDWSYRAGQLTSIRNYIAVLEEAGLIRISGRHELADGRACVVTLLPPPELSESGVCRRSSAGRALHS